MKTLLLLFVLITTAQGQMFSESGGFFNVQSKGSFNIYRTDNNNNALFYYREAGVMMLPVFHYSRRPYIINYDLKYMEYNIGGYSTSPKFIIRQGSYYIY